MSEAGEVRAEIVKLARHLSRDPEDLGYLADAPPVDLRRLRERLADVLFDDHGHVLGRLPAASKLLPVGLIALLAERAFGPVVAARIAGMLEPIRAIAVATKLPAMFLADVAMHIDPRRGSAVIAGIPPALMAEVTRELARRGEFVTIGRLVGHLGTQATAAALDGMNPTTAVQFGAAGQTRSRVVIAELELNGYAIERVYDRGRLVGLRRIEPEDAATGARGRRHCWFRRHRGVAAGSPSPDSCATGASRAGAETLIWQGRYVPLVITGGVDSNPHHTRDEHKGARQGAGCTSWRLATAVE